MAKQKIYLCTLIARMQMVVYTGEDEWNKPIDIFELFGEQQALAREVFLQPYQLIDICRIPDEELREKLWGGLVTYAFKAQKARDFEKFLDTLVPWIYEIRLDGGSEYCKIVLKYVMREFDADDLALFLKKIEPLPDDLRREVMTLEQQIEQRGIQKGEIIGMQKGKIEGKLEGKLEGEKAILIRLLERKFGTLSPQYLETIDRADAIQLSRFVDDFVQAKSLAEVFEQAFEKMNS